MMSKSERLSLLLVLAGPLLLFAPLLLRGEVLFWGTPMLQFVPWHRYALEIFRSGQIPLWNPLVGMGAPLLANLQSAVLYPPNLLLWIIGPEAGHGYQVLLHLLLAGVGMWLLARKLGFSPFGQMLAGLAFSLSGYMIARAWFISINHAAAWLPWLVLFTEQLVECKDDRPPLRASSGPVLRLAAALAFQWLAGHAQTAWYSLILLGLWVIWRGWSRHDRKPLLWLVSRMILAGVIAAALSAVQLVPTIEYLGISQRSASLDREFALTYSFWPWRILGFIFPNMFGNPASGNYWGYGNFWEDAIYFGILPFAFAIASIWRGVRSSRGFALQRFLITLVLASLILALGKNTPVFPLLFDHVPSFNLFQAPARWNLLLIFSLALLAAGGADRWGNPTGRGLYWTRLLTAGAAIIGVASYLALRILPQIEPTFVRSFAVGGVFLTVSGLLTLFLPKERTSLKIGLVGAFILIDLVLAGQGLNPSIQPVIYESHPLTEQGYGGAGRIYMPADLEQELKFDQTHRFDTFDPGVDWYALRATGLANTSMLEGIATINNFDPMLPDRYVTFMQTLEAMPEGQQNAWLAWMGVAFRLGPIADEPAGVSYEPLAGSGRIHVVGSVIFAESGIQSLELMRTGGLELERRAVIEGVPIPGAEGSGEGRILEVVEDGPQRLEFRTSSSGTSWLVIADSWYPGWVAKVDGVETEIFRANYLFRAIALPSGEHTIVFEYKPVSFILGGSISAAGILLWLLLGLLWRRKK